MINDVLEKIDKYRELRNFLYENPNLSMDDLIQVKKRMFKLQTKRELNLDNPQTFREKLQWMMLHYQNPQMTVLADKFKVREYIKQKIGEKYLVNILGVYDSFEDIDFSKLPDRFVLKVNWGSGQNLIVNNKSELNIEEAKEKFNKWLQPKYNHYYFGLEWCYKNIEPKIVCEEYLESVNKSALDYKFMCFNGIPLYCWVSDKYKDVQERSFYDMDWNMQDIELVERHKIKAPNPVEKPENFEEMKQLAEILCKGWPHIRVDFYKLDNGDIKFGELTFFTSCGYSKWSPEEVDFEMGKYINIEEIKQGEFYV